MTQKTTRPRKRWLTTRDIAIMALLLSMNIVISRSQILSFRPTPNVRISFGFLPTALMAILVGPWKAGTVNAVWDIVNTLLFAPYPYFPGFTLSAFLGPMFYGTFMHRRRPRWYHVLAAVLINTIFVNLFLNTLWNIMLGGLPIMQWTTWAAMLPERIISNGIMAPVRFITILFFVATPRLNKAMMKFSTAPDKESRFDHSVERATGKKDLQENPEFVDY